MISPSAYAGFIDACLSVAPRWRTLTLSGVWDEEDEDISLARMLGDLIHGRIITLPRLRELCIMERSFNEASGNLEWYYSADFSVCLWNTPVLEVVRCTEYIPPSTFPFKSVTHFALSLTLMHTDVGEQIHHRDADIRLGAKLHIAHLFICSSITTFRLRVSNFTLTRGPNNLLLPFVESLQMPHLENFLLTIELCPTDAMFLGFTDATAHGLLSILLPDPRGPHRFCLNQEDLETQILVKHTRLNKRFRY